MVEQQTFSLPREKPWFIEVYVAKGKGQVGGQGYLTPHEQRSARAGCPASRGNLSVRFGTAWVVGAAAGGKLRPVEESDSPLPVPSFDRMHAPMHRPSEIDAVAPISSTHPRASCDACESVWCYVTMTVTTMQELGIFLI